MTAREEESLLAGMTPRDRLRALQYANDLFEEADESPVNRQALVLATAMLADAERHTNMARSIRSVLAHPPVPSFHHVPWRQRVSDRRDARAAQATTR